MADKAPLIDSIDASDRMSYESDNSVSTTSIVFDRISERLSNSANNNRSSSKRRTSPAPRRNGTPYTDHDTLSNLDEDDPLKEEAASDLETGPFLASDAVTGGKHMDRSLKRLIFILAGVFVAAWVIALFVYISSKSYLHSSDFEHDPQATVSRGSAKKLTLDQINQNFWVEHSHDISWIQGAGGEDGLLLEKGDSGKDFLVVEDVRSKSPSAAGNARADVASTKTLMKDSTFIYAGKQHNAGTTIPSWDLKHVLIATDEQSTFRHSSTGIYWIFNVNQQSVEPLIPGAEDAKVQLVSWSPTSSHVAFVRDNNMYVRQIASQEVKTITDDGGTEYFYGRPDWVYEEEVFGSDHADWWSQDGKYIALLRTNETMVPEYPIQYFIQRPRGKKPEEGEENYPEVRKIKYPKAGAPNPVVDLLFYDLERGDVFEVKIDGGFEDDDRIISEVIWAGKKVLVKEKNRIQDSMRVVLVDVMSRTGKTVRTVDMNKEDGGWFEESQKTQYIPADASKGRPGDGYIDTVVYKNYDHLAYFTPLDNPDPVMITKGDWDVDAAPSSVDLDRNLVYFVATKESSIQRHVYSVSLNGSNLQPVTNTSAEGYYDVSFSHGSGYAFLTYSGPNIPWQKVISTPSNAGSYEHVIEDNARLADLAKKYALPLKIYGTLEVDGVKLNYLERRPPYFNPNKKYPVLFQLYNGPNSQQVTKKFSVDIQSYFAAALGYIVVTVDGRGTGYIGRSNRVLIRGNLGHWEAHDQIAAAKHWAGLPYIDPSRIAIWGWSYGGFMALKTLEQDAGQTFSYGVAVAPVTDWRYYDSIYTERYMKTPQENEAGYDSSAINNVSALASNVRFLIMHGVADDNVHMQNSLTLLDKLDVARVENYDVHFFPDSDHSIYFHNARVIVYDSKSCLPLFP